MLANPWALDPFFKHDPTAIVHFILALFIAFVLRQNFFISNSKPRRRAHLTLMGLARELVLGIANLQTPLPGSRG